MKIVYIDAQNVHRRMQDRWRVVDWSKFFIYLKDHISPDMIYFAVWYMQKHQDFYNELELYGYTMLYKEVIIKPNWDIKGNVDIDIAIRLILDMCEEWLRSAYIVTNDGDYNTLIKICKDRRVLWWLITPDAVKASKILTKIAWDIIDMQEIRKYIERQKDLSDKT